MTLMGFEPTTHWLWAASATHWAMAKGHYITQQFKHLRFTYLVVTSHVMYDQLAIIFWGVCNDGPSPLPLNDNLWALCTVQWNNLYIHWKSRNVMKAGAIHSYQVGLSTSLGAPIGLEVKWTRDLSWWRVFTKVLGPLSDSTWVFPSFFSETHLYYSPYYYGFELEHLSTSRLLLYIHLLLFR